MTGPDQVTREELAALVGLLDRRMDGVERSLNGFPLVFGSVLVLVFALEVFIALWVGL